MLARPSYWHPCLAELFGQFAGVLGVQRSGEERAHVGRLDVELAGEREVGNQSNEHQDSRSDAADEGAKQPPQDDRAFRRGPGRRSARAKLPILPGRFRGMESRTVAGAIFDHDATLCVGATPVEFGGGFLQTDRGRDGSGVLGIDREMGMVGNPQVNCPAGSQNGLCL